MFTKGLRNAQSVFITCSNEPVSDTVEQFRIMGAKRANAQPIGSGGMCRGGFSLCRIYYVIISMSSHFNSHPSVSSICFPSPFAVDRMNISIRVKEK